MSDTSIEEVLKRIYVFLKGNIDFISKGNFDDRMKEKFRENKKEYEKEDLQKCVLRLIKSIHNVTGGPFGEQAYGKMLETMYEGSIIPLCSCCGKEMELCDEEL